MTNVGTKSLTLGLAAAVCLLFAGTAQAQDYPLGSYAPSLGAAPIDGVGTIAPGVPMEAEAGFVYSLETVLGLWANFDIDTPGTINQFGPGPLDPFPGAGAFGPDPGTVYGIYGTDVYSVNPDDGTHTSLGSVAAEFGETFTGLTWDPTTETYYASSGFCNDRSWLYTFDPSGPSVSLVGLITGATCAVSIAATPDGSLYVHDLVDDVLVSVDKGTGAGTVVGSTGFDANFGQGMEWDASTGQMLMAAFNNAAFAAELRSVDVNTGNTTFLGTIGLNVGGFVQFPYAGIVQGDGGMQEEYDFEMLDEFGFLWLADAVAGETPCEGVGTALDGIAENVYVNGATMSGYVCKTPRELEITAVNNRGDGCELETDSFTYTGTRIGPNQWGGDWTSFCEGIGVIGEGTWTGDAVKNFKGDTPPMRVSFAGGNPARVDGLAGKQVAETPTTYALEQNYPNPFNPTTMVAFQLPEASEVSVRVFNALGQEVATLVDGYREAGRYEVSFDATELSAGVYLYSIEAEGFRTTKQMVLLK